MMNSYHNTLYHTGMRLNDYEAKAARQDSQVLAFMRANRDVIFTAEQIHELVMPRAPLTSARRCLSNLKKRGKVEMTDRPVEGQYGHTINTWRLVCR